MSTIKYFGQQDVGWLALLIKSELEKYILASDFNTAIALKANKAGDTFTGPIYIPTAAAGTNDTTAASTAYVTLAIANAMASVVGIHFDGDTSGQGYLSLSDLQTKHPIGADGTIYLVQNSGSGANTKDEYFWNGDSSSGSYELFGTTSVDLSGYVRAEDLVQLTQQEVKDAWDTVFPPANNNNP